MQDVKQGGNTTGADGDPDCRRESEMHDVLGGWEDTYFRGHDRKIYKSYLVRKTIHSSANFNSLEIWDRELGVAKWFRWSDPVDF